MQAAVFTDYGQPLEIEEVERPEPDPDAVVVETDACGICRSDWHAWKGDFKSMGVELSPGHILGHEPVGRVSAVGDDVETLQEGDHVTVPFNLGDGTCPLCRKGYGNICESILPLGFTPLTPGAFAEAFPVHAADHNVVKLEGGLDPVAMAALGCRFTTAYHALAHRADVTPGDWIAIQGCGGVGLSAIHIADALGANVVAVDISDDKLEQAETVGGDVTLNATKEDDIGVAVKSVTDGGAHISVDALGIKETCQNSIASLGRRGQHLQIGLTSSEEQGMIPLPTDTIVQKEIEVIGCYGMQPTRYDEIFRMMEQGKVDPGVIVGETVGLDDVPEQLSAMDDYETQGIPVITSF